MWILLVENGPKWAKPSLTHLGFHSLAHLPSLAHFTAKFHSLAHLPEQGGEGRGRIGNKGNRERGEGRGGVSLPPSGSFIYYIFIFNKTYLLKPSLKGPDLLD